VVVTGATGKTGVLAYRMLKERGATVRAFVRNASKARELLGCTACDPSEGVFLGDVKDKASLEPAVKGADTLVVVTSAFPICKHGAGGPPQCYYPEGAYPVDVDFHGGKAQITAFAEANPKGRVVLVSTMGTTNPESFTEKMGNGHIGFYKLNAEAFLMNSGLPFVIIKPCGLVNTPGGKAELLVGHDDDIDVKPPTVPREDVARVMVEAISRPPAVNLRFDLCSRAGEPTEADKVLAAAEFPWQRGGQAAAVLVA